MGSDEWKAVHAKSKFKGVADFAANAKGRIMLQDHGDEVWFRGLMIRELGGGCEGLAAFSLGEFQGPARTRRASLTAKGMVRRLTRVVMTMTRMAVASSPP